MCSKLAPFGHGKFSEVVTVNAFACINAHEVISALIIRGPETNGANATFAIGVIRTGINLVVSTKDGFEMVSVDFAPTENDGSWTKRVGNAVRVREAVEAGYNHVEALIDHEFGSLFKRKGYPEAASALLEGTNGTFYAWDVLASPAYF